MPTHIVKSWPDYFVPLHSGVKTFEVRRNDRDYHVGDLLRIREWDDKTLAYTGREITRRISFMLEGVGAGGIAPLAGIFPGFVIMSLENVR